jgi:hypothetical protein
MPSKARQYTVRNVPASLDRALRRKATERRISLNTLVLQALAAEAGVRPEPRRHRDLDGFFGSWIEDPAVDAALADQRQVDAADWAD